MKNKLNTFDTSEWLKQETDGRQSINEWSYLRILVRGQPSFNRSFPGRGNVDHWVWRTSRGINNIKYGGMGL